MYAVVAAAAVIIAIVFWMGSSRRCGVRGYGARLFYCTVWVWVWVWENETKERVENSSKVHYTITTLLEK